jgi:AraC-like DNA-binding protein
LVALVALTGICSAADSVSVPDTLKKTKQVSAPAPAAKPAIKPAQTKTVLDSFSFLDDYPVHVSTASGKANLAPQRTQGLKTHLKQAGAFFKHTLLKYLVLILSVAIITATVVFFRNRRRNNQNFMKQTRLSIMDKEVRRACKYIESNYANPLLNPQFICQELVTGESFLEALFERELGMTISGFVSQVRIHHARRLRESDSALSIQEVASQSGFNDIKSLQETWAQVTGKNLEP